jgi:hypothetical protein
VVSGLDRCTPRACGACCVCLCKGARSREPGCWVTASGCRQLGAIVSCAEGLHHVLYLVLRTHRGRISFATLKLSCVTLTGPAGVLCQASRKHTSYAAVQAAGCRKALTTAAYVKTAAHARRRLALPTMKKPPKNHRQDMLTGCVSCHCKPSNVTALQAGSLRAPPVAAVACVC